MGNDKRTRTEPIIIFAPAWVSDLRRIGDRVPPSGQTLAGPKNQLSGKLREAGLPAPDKIDVGERCAALAVRIVAIGCDRQLDRRTRLARKGPGIIGSNIGSL
jgi:hypothetical protein